MTDSGPIGVSPLEMAVRSVGVTGFVHQAEVTSTMDVAHQLAAEGAPAGTLVLADRQRFGRGRTGKLWASEDGAGVWCTMIERPEEPTAFGVLSLRVGLLLAAALDAFADTRIQLKWPNDLFTPDGKLGGILTEARWRGDRIEWVAIGIGINRRVPSELLGPAVRVAAVRAGVPVLQLLPAVARAVREAAAIAGPLTVAERERWASRDIARGRAIIAPLVGTVQGLAADGGLQVRDEQGVIRTVQSGSLQFLD